MIREERSVILVTRLTFRWQAVKRTFYVAPGTPAHWDMDISNVSALVLRFLSFSDQTEPSCLCEHNRRNLDDEFSEVEAAGPGQPN